MNTVEVLRKKLHRLGIVHWRLFSCVVLLGITGLMDYFAYVEQDPVLAAFTPVWGVLSAGLIYSMNRSRRRDPERILWVVEWLEWRLLGGYEERR